MNCPACGHDNPLSVTYCQQCGDNLNMDADAIAQSYRERARGDAVKSTSHYTKNMFMFGIALFFLSISMFVMTGGVPEKPLGVIPSASNGSSYVEVQYELEVDIPALPIPLGPPPGDNNKKKKKK